MADPVASFDSIDAVQSALAGEQYFADRAMATTIFLSERLRKPLFLEGEDKICGGVMNVFVERIQ